MATKPLQLTPLAESIGVTAPTAEASARPSARRKAIQLTPLAQETRAAIPTAEAAAHLNRAQQTLLLWSCKENGPLRPVRVMGRLAWPVADIKRLLGVPA